MASSPPLPQSVLNAPIYQGPRPTTSPSVGASPMTSFSEGASPMTPTPTAQADVLNDSPAVGTAEKVANLPSADKSPTPVPASSSSSPTTASSTSNGYFSSPNPSLVPNPVASPQRQPVASLQVPVMNESLAKSAMEVLPANDTLTLQDLESAKVGPKMQELFTRAYAGNSKATASNIKFLEEKVKFFGKKGSLTAKEETIVKYANQMLEKLKTAGVNLPIRKTTVAKNKSSVEKPKLNLAPEGGTTLEKPKASRKKSTALKAAGGSTAAGSSTAAANMNASKAEMHGKWGTSPQVLKRRMTQGRRKLRERKPTPYPSPNPNLTPLSPSPLNLGPGAEVASKTFRRLVNTPLVSQPLKTRKNSKSPSPEQKYLEAVIPQFLPLPELFNPLTGTKFDPGESPLEDIETSYKELSDFKTRVRKLVSGKEFKTAYSKIKEMVDRGVWNPYGKGGTAEKYSYLQNIVDMFEHMFGILEVLEEPYTNVKTAYEQLKQIRSDARKAALKLQANSKSRKRSASR